MHHNSRSNDRGAGSVDAGDHITKKVAASSPSRPNLEIIRRVPSNIIKPKAAVQEHPQREVVSCERDEKP